jgi:hypothetical protein
MKRNAISVLITIFVFACIHAGVLSYKALTTGNINYLNFFKFLDFQLVLPQFTVGFGNFIISYLFVILTFGLVYWMVRKRIKK